MAHAQMLRHKRQRLQNKKSWVLNHTLLSVWQQGFFIGRLQRV